jgi:hypothetical protein
LFVGKAGMSEKQDWLRTAPWLFDFAGMTSAMWSHGCIGLGVTILAAAEIWKLHRRAGGSP